ncbi:hypothetical protein QFZ73_001552 [Peribacillus sp. V2I11]|nr:hypothetical protein [Peribacillus sp. V2I11]
MPDNTVLVTKRSYLFICFLAEMMMAELKMIFGLKTEMQHTFKIVVHFQFGEEKR